MATKRIPTDLPNTRTIDWGGEIRKAWGDEWHKREVAYKFSNGRKFETSTPNGGPYGDSAESDA